MDALKRILSTCIPNGMALPILSGPLRGRRWLAGSAPGPAKGLSVLFNRCEPGQLQEALRLAKPGGIFFDIGANAGLYSLLLAKVSSRIFAFEPVPENLGYLERTFVVNKVKNVQIIPWAMGGETRLDAFQLGAVSSEGKVDPDGDMPVFTVTADEFSARYKVIPTLLKIDVEGTEIEVLKGAAGILKSGKPPILLSTHGDQPKKACIDFLQAMGYRSFIPLDHAKMESAREFSVSG